MMKIHVPWNRDGDKSDQFRPPTAAYQRKEWRELSDHGKRYVHLHGCNPVWVAAVEG